MNALSELDEYKRLLDNALCMSELRTRLNDFKAWLSSRAGTVNTCKNLVLFYEKQLQEQR